MTCNHMIALFSWETDWPELCRAPILYNISELDCDYCCSWTCIFSSLRDLVEVEVTEMGEIWVWMWGRRKALQSQDCSIIWQGMCVQGGKGGWWQERAGALMFVFQICITVLFSITMTPAFLGKAPPFTAVGSVPHISAMTIYQTTLLSYWNELLTR